MSDDSKNIIDASIGETHLDANQKPAFRHDVKMVQKTLDNIGFDIPRNVTTKIGGDKGYVTKKRFRLNNGKRSPIITRKKKNQIKKNTSNQKKYLGKRYTVENSRDALRLREEKNSHSCECLATELRQRVSDARLIVLSCHGGWR